MTLLAIDGLAKSFGGVAAVRDVSLIVGAGEVVALIGPNGAGKSTLFNMVGGQLAPDRGEVRLDGVAITRLAPRRRFALGIGRTFQVAQTFLSMTACENVQMALLSQAGETGRVLAGTRGLHRRHAIAVLARVGLADAADRSCRELAYGDIKRLELAIALAGEPRLLLMDEPTAGMAPRERAHLMALTVAIARTGGIGVLFTEHDMDVVFGHATRILVLVRGEIVAQGAGPDIRANAQVREAYLGHPASTGPLA